MKKILRSRGGGLLGLSYHFRSFAISGIRAVGFGVPPFGGDFASKNWVVKKNAQLERVFAIAHPLCSNPFTTCVGWQKFPRVCKMLQDTLQ
jgi:hypothetical protein